MLKKNLEHEEICRSASIILKNISMCTKNDLNCETLFFEIGGFDFLLKTISKHKKSEDICECILDVIKAFTKAMENGRIKGSEKDEKEFINIIDSVMASNKSSRKIARKCLSIFSSVVKHKCNITNMPLTTFMIVQYLDFQDVARDVIDKDILKEIARLHQEDEILLYDLSILYDKLFKEKLGNIYLSTFF